MSERTKTGVECITGDEGEAFFFSDDLLNDLLSITSVHPVREDVVERLLIAFLKDKKKDIKAQKP